MRRAEGLRDVKHFADVIHGWPYKLLRSRGKRTRHSPKAVGRKLHFVLTIRIEYGLEREGSHFEAGGSRMKFNPKRASFLPSLRTSKLGSPCPKWTMLKALKGRLHSFWMSDPWYKIQATFLTGSTIEVHSLPLPVATLFKNRSPALLSSCSCAEPSGMICRRDKSSRETLNSLPT